jgi:hypothetical protein
MSSQAPSEISNLGQVATLTVNCKNAIGRCRFSAWHDEEDSDNEMEVLSWNLTLFEKVLFLLTMMQNRQTMITVVDKMVEEMQQVL